MPPLGHKFNKVWEAFYDKFCPTVLRWFIPRSGKDSADMPFNVLIFFGSGPVDNLKFFGSPILLVYYDPGNVLPCCFFPYLDFHYYNYLMWSFFIYNQQSQDF